MDIKRSCFYLWLINFLIKKKKNASGSGIKNEIKQNEQFAEELHKPIKNFQKKKSIFIIHRQYYD